MTECISVCIIWVCACVVRAQEEEGGNDSGVSNITARLLHQCQEELSEPGAISLLPILQSTGRAGRGEEGRTSQKFGFKQGGKRTAVDGQHPASSPIKQAKT